MASERAKSHPPTHCNSFVATLPIQRALTQILHFIVNVGSIFC